MFTGGVEACLQRLQWISRLSTWRHFRFSVRHLQISDIQYFIKFSSKCTPKKSVLYWLYIDSSVWSEGWSIMYGNHKRSLLSTWYHDSLVIIPYVYIYHVCKPIQYHFNSFWPCDIIWRHRSMSTLAQVMACCLTAPSHSSHLWSFVAFTWEQFHSKHPR